MIKQVETAAGEVEMLLNKTYNMQDITNNEGRDSKALLKEEIGYKTNRGSKKEDEEGQSLR